MASDTFSRLKVPQIALAAEAAPRIPLGSVQRSPDPPRWITGTYF